MILAFSRKRKVDLKSKYSRLHSETLQQTKPYQNTAKDTGFVSLNLKTMSILMRAERMSTRGFVSQEQHKSSNPFFLST